MYDPVSWAYAGEAQHPASEPIEARTGESYSERQSRTKAEARPDRPMLQHPRCVFQILKRHFARYTPELVEQVCGTPQDVPKGRPGARGELRARAHRGLLLRRRLDAAHRRRADDPRRDCNSCSATSVGPAAASWPCAATPRSRARPTSPRSTTCCRLPAHAACQPHETLDD